jgi:hypothetical protein
MTTKKRKQPQPQPQPQLQLQLQKQKQEQEQEQKRGESKSESEVTLSLFQCFQLVEGAGPVCAEEAGQASVCEDFAAGLALGAVVGLVVGVADALDGLAAGWAWLAEATVDGHVVAEGGDFLGKVLAGFGVEAIDPELEGVAGGGEEARPLFAGEFAGELDRGEVRGVEDLVGVGVADAAEDARVGEGSLEGAVFGGQGGSEFVETRGEDIDAAGIDGLHVVLVAEEVKGGATFGAGFGEDERAVRKVEGGEIVAAAQFGSDRTPVQTAGDHEVQDEPVAVVEFYGDALPDAAQGTHGVAFERFEGWLDSAQEEGACYADLG